MKILPIMLLFSAFAGVAASGAKENPVAHPSPDGSVTLRNIADPDYHFQITNRGGDVLLASDKHPYLETGSFAESIIWSPDGRHVAFSVRTSGPYICDTFVYSVRSKQLARVPTEDYDYQTRPVRWHDNHTLIVQTEAPFGGEATEDKVANSYRYRRTIRFFGSPIQFETLYTAPRTRRKS
ncbi:MAG: hypothetical protein J0M04_08795 [Verrucomicrobia bacterium]|nr:hypothetical protein [Verrucomicrobiota bacterium]